MNFVDEAAAGGGKFDNVEGGDLEAPEIDEKGGAVQVEQPVAILT